MRPVYQATKDDCFKCCIASLLDLDYEQVPHFYEGAESNTPVPTVTTEAINKWFAARGLYLVEVPMQAYTVSEMLRVLALLHPGLNVMLSGESPRHLAHAVIVRDSKIVLDPSRDGGGLIGPVPMTGLYYAGYIARFT